MLVAITGIDGAGKSTVCGALAERLSSRGMSATVIKAELVTNPAWHRYDALLDTVERDDEDLAGRLRASLVCLEAAVYADHVADLLQTHEVVLCDRYLEAIRLYMAVRNLPVADLDRVAARAPTPDVTILLRLTVAESLRRLASLGESVEGMHAFLHAMHEGLEGGEYTATVDAAAPLDEVVAAAERVVMASRR